LFFVDEDLMIPPPLLISSPKLSNKSSLALVHLSPSLKVIPLYSIVMVKEFKVNTGFKSIVKSGKTAKCV